MLLRQQGDIDGVLKHLQQLLSTALLNATSSVAVTTSDARDVGQSLLKIEQRLAEIEQRLPPGSDD